MRFQTCMKDLSLSEMRLVFTDFYVGEWCTLETEPLQLLYDELHETTMRHSIITFTVPLFDGSYVSNDSHKLL